MNQRSINIRGVTSDARTFAARLDFLGETLTHGFAVETDVVVVKLPATLSELCQKAFSTIVPEPISFTKSSIEIRQASFGTLDRITDFAHDCQSVSIVITGHTDTTGDESWNKRLSIARVLLHDPRVLLLDEPASGLDPRARIEIRELLKELRNMGKTIIISSHILHELAELCTTVGILEGGELLYHGSISEIVARARRGTRVHVKVAEQQELAGKLLKRVRGIKSVADHNGMLLVELENETHDFTGIAKLLLENNFRLCELKEEEVNLETAFMRLTKGLVQ